MARGNKDKRIDVNGVKQVLGRIFRHAEGDLPFMLVKERSKRIELSTVFEVIAQNPKSNDHDIVGKIGIDGVRPADIEIARAYIHRFGNDVAKPLTIKDHQNPTLLLDENTPQAAMLPLSRQFGWTTHVSAENLAGRDTPDADIWDYASQHKFAAIVTRDTDFFYIQKHRGAEAADKGQHAPLLIFVADNLSTESLSNLFHHHADDLREHIKAQTLACRLALDNGCHELHL